MGSLLIAIILAASIGTWLYTRLARQTGSGNTQNAAIGAAIAGVVIFFVSFSILKLLGL